MSQWLVGPQRLGCTDDLPSNYVLHHYARWIGRTGKESAVALLKLWNSPGDTDESRVTSINLSGTAPKTRGGYLVFNSRRDFMSVEEIYVNLQVELALLTIVRCKL